MATDNLKDDRDDTPPPFSLTDGSDTSTERITTRSQMNKHEPSEPSQSSDHENADAHHILVALAKQSSTSTAPRTAESSLSQAKKKRKSESKKGTGRTNRKRNRSTTESKINTMASGSSSDGGENPTISWEWQQKNNGEMVGRTTSRYKDGTTKVMTEVMDGKMTELQQRQWLRRVHVDQIGRSYYDNMHASASEYQYGSYEWVNKHLTEFAQGINKNGFLLIKGFASNRGSRQEKIMNDVVTKKTWCQDRCSGVRPIDSAIHYISDKRFPDGVPYLMDSCLSYMNKHHVNNRLQLAENDTRELVTIILIDPSDENMLKLRRIYLELNGEQLEMGKMHGSVKLGDIGEYTTRGVKIHYIHQGNHARNRGVAFSLSYCNGDII
jgi:hypothetical protein